MGKKAKRAAKRQAEAAMVAVERVAKQMRISHMAIGSSRGGSTEKVNPFVMPSYPKGVLPKGATKLAMDEAMAVVAQALEWGGGYHGLWDEGIGFQGYPYLAELSQRAEYMRAAKVFAGEMTRKWIRLKAVGDEDKTDKITRLDAAMKKHKLRDVFHDAIEMDCYYGRGQIFIDVGEDHDDERATPLSLTKAKIGLGGLKRFTVIDPTWTAPMTYDSRDPTNPTFYKPQSWWVMARPIHASRMLTMISRPVRDILKPAYNFGGLSLSQIMKPYVDNWLRTRQAVSDLINSFTVFVLSTNMSALLTGGDGGPENNRLDVFNQQRSSRGAFEIDKDTESFQNISVPLGGLDHLQAQSQEHMATPSGIPVVKFFGLTPSGLNVSTDGEMRAFYDLMHSEQERVMGDPLTTSLQVLQIDEFGEIDPDISYEFVQLWELDDVAKATIRKTNADTDAVLITECQAITPQESRQRLAAEMDSPYHGLELAAGPDTAEGEEDETFEDQFITRLRGGGNGGGGGGDFKERFVAALAADEFKEADHPRDDDGKFGSGGGGGGPAPSGEKDKPAEKPAQQQQPRPAHLAKLRIPPAWTDVKYNADPKASLWVTGKDSKGRPQYIYNPEFAASQSAAKFARIAELNSKFTDIYRQNEEARQSTNPRTRALGDATHLIMQMGIRPGSETDTKAEKQAYGATTLKGEHVVVEGDQVFLRFTGKKGVDLNLPVPNADTARMLTERATKAGPDGQLFPEINEKLLLDHVHSFNGGGFKTKDFRTRLGTSTAVEMVSKMQPPKTEKDYKKAVMDVAKAVSQKLGNTPTIALQAYIAPQAFAPWQHGDKS